MLNAPLDSLYFGGDIEILRQIAGELPAEFVLSDGNNSKKLIAEIIGSNDDISKTLFNNYSKSLQKAVGSVFGKTDYGDDNFDLQQQLLANVSRFAAHKAYLVTQAVQRQVADKHGVVRTDAEFYEYAQKVLNTANRYQAAEYHAALARSRTAKQWREFSEDRDVPNLKWIPSRSATPRESHKKFWGLVLPKNHPFWQTNQPGNIWNCKCDWVETFDKPASGTPPQGKPAAGLEGNPAETGEIFTQNASYIKATPINILNDVISNVFYNDSLSNLKINVLADKNEIADNVRTGRILAENENVKTIKIREDIKDGRKNPEYEINNFIADAKRVQKPYKNGIKDSFKSAIKQGCECVIIDFNPHFFDKSITLETNILVKKILNRKIDFSTGRIKECFLVFSNKSACITLNDMTETQLTDIINKLRS